MAKAGFCGAYESLELPEKSHPERKPRRYPFNQSGVNNERQSLSLRPNCFGLFPKLETLRQTTPSGGKRE